MANNEPQGRPYTLPDDVVDVEDDGGGNEEYLAVDDADEEELEEEDDDDDDVEDEEEDDDEGEEENDDDEEEEEEEDDDDEEESEGEEILNSNSQSRVLVDTESEVARDEGSKEEEEEKSGGGEEWNRSEMDGLFCPICMEGWTTGGDHQVCCLACGHIYGMSCIKKWLQQGKRSGKCPQCNRKSTLKDIRVLYASRVVALDEELQKKVRSLEARCASLKLRQALSGAGSTGAGASQGITNDVIVGYLRMLTRRLDRLDRRLDQIDGRLDSLVGQLDRSDGRFGRVEGLTSESNTSGTVRLDMVDHVARGIHDTMPPDQ